MIPVAATLTMPDASAAIDVTPYLSGLPDWTTSVPGGFGSCSLSLLGDWTRRAPYLSSVRLARAGRVLFEGIVEQRRVRFGDGPETTLTCTGPQRLLQTARIARLYALRDIPWQTVATASGTGDLGEALAVSHWNVTVGELTAGVTGVRLTGSQDGETAAGGEYGGVEYASAAQLTRLLCDTEWLAPSAKLIVQSSPDGTVWTREATSLSTGAMSQALTAGAQRIRLGIYSLAGSQFAGDGAFKNVRLLGTSLDEDVAGSGFYGGTLLRDLVGQVVGLHAGLVDAGSDYAIANFGAGQRAAVRDLVESVASYYQREWAVWEGGRFDWRTVLLDEPQWVAPADAFADLDIDGTISDMPRTVFVNYTLAGSTVSKVATASATSQRNPWVRSPFAKDLEVQAPGPMADADAARLASTVAALLGGFPAARGTARLAADTVLSGPSQAPAFCVRAGDNVLIPDLPRTAEAFANGRDGETLFHVVATECDGGYVTLTLDTQPGSADVLLARLAADLAR